MAQLQGGDLSAVLVGEKARVPVPMLVEDRELRAGMRTFAPSDQAAILPGMRTG